MIRSLFCFTLLLGSLPCHALTADELQRFIDEAAKADGGSEVVIPPGNHVLDHSLVIRNAKKLRIAGLDAETTVLELQALAFGESSAIAKAGDDVIQMRRMQGLKPGMRLRVEAKGHGLVEVKSVAEDRITLTKALGLPCPAGVLLRSDQASNIFEIRGASELVQIDKLTLDGGRKDGDPLVRDQGLLGGIVATGDYGNEKSPEGSRIKGVRIERCFFQNFHGSGISLQACEDATVQNCTFRDSASVAIRFDPFTTGSQARHNHIARCLTGIELNRALNCLIDQNDLLACGTGIRVSSTSNVSSTEEKHIIRGNQIEQTSGNAIQMDAHTANSTITGNFIQGSSGHGILLSGQAHIVKDNQITLGTKEAVYVSAGEHEIDAR